MNSTIPVTITLPKDLVASVKAAVPRGEFSEFLAEAAREKLAKVARKNAHKKLRTLPSLFHDIDNSALYVKNLRKSDEKRIKRLGI